MDDDGFYERNGEEIGFVISVMSGEQDRIDIAQAAAQQLQEIGINCTVDIPAQMDWGGQMACLIGWGSPFDADDHTYKVFGTDKGANYSGYSNEKVDEYLTLARQYEDQETRANIMIFSRKSWQRIRHMHLSVILMPIMWQIRISKESPKRPYLVITELVFSGIFRNGKS